MKAVRSARLVGVLVTGALALGGTVLSPPATAAPAGVFQDFETDADLTGLTVSLPQVDSADRVGYPTHGRSSVRFTVGPANTPGASASAGLTLHAGTPSLPVTDWSGHAAFGWDFFTDTVRDTVGRITIRDSHNRAWGANYPIRFRGWTAFNVRISALTAAGLDVTSIRYVSVSIPRGATPVRGYYDAFRLLEEYPYDQSAFGDRAVASLLELGRFDEVLTGLSRTLDGLGVVVGRRPHPADRRLSAQVRSHQEAVTGLREMLGPAMDAETYADFNARVAAAEQAVPRLALTIRARKRAPSSDFGLDSADSMTLVYPKDLPFESTGPKPTLRLARGEYESVQLVVLPYAEPLTNVSARVAAVRGSHGKGEAKDLSVTVEPVGSLYVVPSSAYRRSVYTGWTPDPIRHDLDRVDVAATDVQPFWVRVVASAHARPGTYRISIEVSADGKRSHTMTVTATVWPFAVPDEPKLSTAFQFTPWIINELYGLDDEPAREAMKHRFWSFLNEYKIKPDQIYTVDRAEDDTFVYRPTPVEDPLYIKEHYGLRRFNALYLNATRLDPQRPGTWQQQIDTWLAQLDAAMADYREAGVAEYAYVYGFDEVSGPLIQAAKQTFTAIKERYPDLPIMTTLRDNSLGVDSGLAGLVDIWVPQHDLYDQSVAERTRARDDEVWWYSTIATGFPLPNWFNGYPPIDARMLMGPMSYQAGVEGVLYYATNRWLPADHANQPLVEDGVFSEWNPVTFGTTAGDGSLFYPGPDGPMASIRIENVRDGIEDYNLLWLLKRELDAHPDAPAEVRARAEQALSARAVVTNPRTFTEDPVTYRTWRDQAARALMDLT
jgi:hypothetical protein